MKLSWTILTGMLLLSGMLLAQSNLLVNGDLETMEPNFWSGLNDGMNGATVTWTDEDAAPHPWNNEQPSYRSFKIDKPSTTGDAVGWVSDNNADLYWNNAGGNLVYTLRIWAKTAGVNTNPAGDDEAIGVWYRYYSGGSLIAEKLIAVDQGSSSTEWTEYQDALLVTSEPDELIISAVLGKDATGTVHFDNIDCWTDPWTMGVFGGDAEAPKGWMFWTDPNKIGFAAIDETNAHSGTESVLLQETDSEDDEMVFYSEPVPVQANKWYAFGVWIKTQGMNTGETWYPTNVITDRDNDRAGITFFFHRDPLNEAWDLTGGDQFFYLDQRNADSDWTHLLVCAKAPEDATGASMRARFTSFPTGSVWFDDFSIDELDDAPPNLLVNGDLETMEPNFWSGLNDGMNGATVTWTDEDAAPNPWNIDQPSYRSFKIDKPSTSGDAVGWVSDNNADLYWNNAGGNLVYTLRIWAKTAGVNTNPAGDDEAIGVWYRYYSGGSLIAEKLIAVDQGSSSTEWTEYQDALLVTSEPDELIISAVLGKDATGTVHFDNIDCWTDPWTMGVFGGDAEAPKGWMFWTDPNKIGFAALDETNAYSGTESVLLQEADSEDDEMVFYSEPVPAAANQWYKISVMTKAEGLNTGETWYPTNVITDRDNDRAGITFFFHRDPLYEAWDLAGGDQFFYLDQRNADSDWIQNTVIARAPEEATGVSMRARFTSFPIGSVWYDDFTVQMLDVVTIIEDEPTATTTIPVDFNLRQNYPNPFNPETIIEFQVPEHGFVDLNIYNSLGQKIRSLVNEIRPVGTYQVLWDGRDDHGNQMTSGMYLYQLRGTNALITKKMILIR